MYYPYIEPDYEMGYRCERDKMCGEGKIEKLENAPKPPYMRAHYVRFLNGAHTKWHFHSGEQLLLATEGIGLVEFQNLPEVTLEKGDRIIIPAGDLHRHGAQKKGNFIHLAVTCGYISWSEDDPCTVQSYSRG
jgi:quercetin dioxygenase-like cupin family protein